MGNFNNELKAIVDFFESTNLNITNIKYNTETELLKAIKLINYQTEIIDIRPFAYFRWNGAGGYRKYVSFKVYIKHNDAPACINIDGEDLNDDNFREFTDGTGLRHSWNSGSADIGRFLKKYLKKNGINMFLMLTSNNSALINPKYLNPAMLKRSKQSFSIINEEYSNMFNCEMTDIFKVNYKTDGWSSQHSYVYKNVMELNSEYPNVISKISKLLETIKQYRSDIGAFCVDVGSRTLKIDSFYNINGTAGDIRNYSPAEIMKVIGSFISSPSVYSNNRIYIDTKHLTSMFRVRKNQYGDFYTLVQSKARLDTKWSPIRLDEGELEDLISLAEKYNDPDEVMAWRLLADLRD